MVSVYLTLLFLRQNSWAFIEIPEPIFEVQILNKLVMYFIKWMFQPTQFQQILIYKLMIHHPIMAEKFSLMIFKCMIKIIMKDILIMKILVMNTLHFKSLYYLHVFNKFLTKSLSISFFHLIFSQLNLTQ